MSTGGDLGEAAPPEVILGVVVAAGSSARMGGPDKLQALLGDKTVLRRSVEALAEGGASPIVIVVAANRVAAIAAETWLPDCVRAVVAGGSRRQESVAAGIEAAAAALGAAGSGAGGGHGSGAGGGDERGRSGGRPRPRCRPAAGQPGSGSRSRAGGPRARRGDTGRAGRGDAQAARPASMSERPWTAPTWPLPRLRRVSGWA